MYEPYLLYLYIYTMSSLKGRANGGSRIYESIMVGPITPISRGPNNPRQTHLFPGHEKGVKLTPFITGSGAHLLPVGSCLEPMSSTHPVFPTKFRTLFGESCVTKSPQRKAWKLEVPITALSIWDKIT